MARYGIILLLFCFSLGTPARAIEKDFTLETVEGDPIQLQALLQKGPVLLDFWATWCKPCLKSLPKLDDLYREYHEQGFTVLAVNVDGPRSLSKVNPMVHSLDLSFPVVLDSDREVVRLYQVSGFPTSILLSSHGKIITTIRGYHTGDTRVIREHVETLLEHD
jgi:peroxiredoxin